jgi:hypothetical protein
MLIWFVIIYVIAAVRGSVKHKRNNGGRKIEQGYTSSTMSAWLTNQLPALIMTLHLTNTKLSWTKRILYYKRSPNHVLYREGAIVRQARLLTWLPFYIAPGNEVLLRGETERRIFFSWIHNSLLLPSILLFLSRSCVK